MSQKFNGEILEMKELQKSFISVILIFVDYMYMIYVWEST